MLVYSGAQIGMVQRRATLEPHSTTTSTAIAAIADVAIILVDWWKDPLNGLLQGHRPSPNTRVKFNVTKGHSSRLLIGCLLVAVAHVVTVVVAVAVAVTAARTIVMTDLWRWNRSVLLGVVDMVDCHASQPPTRQGKLDTSHVY